MLHKIIFLIPCYFKRNLAISFLTPPPLSKVLFRAVGQLTVEGGKWTVESFRLLEKVEFFLKRIYKESDFALPAFPDDFQVAKYSVFGQENGSKFCVLELQSAKGEQGRRYRVARYLKEDVVLKKAAVMDRLVFLSTSEEALDVYKAPSEELDRSELQKMSSLPAEAPHLGSAPLEQV